MAKVGMTVMRRTGGFTLVELVTVVTIIGILAALAVPSLRQLYLTQQIRGAAAELQTSLYYARSEAVKRAADVQVVPTSNDWAQGWTVQLASGGTVLRKQSALSDQLSSASGSTLTYRNDGRLSGGTVTVTFKTPTTSIPSRCVIVDLSGRPAVVYAGDSASDSCS
jgi:type IV fimbrial biogenesis protein FimT